MGCECLGCPTAAMGQISLEEIASPPRYTAPAVGAGVWTPAEPNLGWCEYTPKPESVAATDTQKSTSQAQTQGV